MIVVEWRGDAVRLLDQTRLPSVEQYLDCRTADEVADAIRTLRVRGAPAIGVAAAYGLALAGFQVTASDLSEWRRVVSTAAEALKATRPTAVNLAWAVDRALAAATPARSVAEARDRLLREARAIDDEDDRANRALGAHGADLLVGARNILTHCNAGGLATTGYGTALGIIRALHERGREIHVWVDETRPVLQGARLTAWELNQEGIAHTLIPDVAAGFLMARGEVDAVVVGADRVAGNGDVANKIGTYTLGVLANAHGVPFYVAAPGSTVDLQTPSGAAIPIEERPADEVRRFAQVPTAPEGTPVRNFAFDVTPARLVRAIITEVGAVFPPYADNLPAAMARLARGQERNAS
ncbi:MAG TPA: S-methyl-5-thioribose-1-phosphate isomerase [Chloroflexota bacterium]|nr:S-methyl-5-thioribose-1-phosphate isomerase [Chloroflexota bacterium]